MWTVERASGVYELRFRRPAFELPKLSVELLREFHSAFSPRFRVEPSDMHVLGGMSLSDVAIRFALFDRSLSIEVTVDRMLARLALFRDATLAKECVHTAEDTLLNVLPELGWASALIRVDTWLTCKEGPDAAKMLLAKFEGGPGLDIEAKKFGALRVKYALRGEIENSEERWRASYMLERSALKDAHVFFATESVYDQGGRYSLYEDRVAHYSQVRQNLLSHFGIEMVGG